MFSATWFFFFQAEDGIRDRDVTGVQTCALPICRRARSIRRTRGLIGCERIPRPARVLRGRAGEALGSEPLRRSEERRVGKECRSRGWGGHQRERVGGARGSEVRDGGKKGVGAEG